VKKLEKSIFCCVVTNYSDGTVHDISWRNGYKPYMDRRKKFMTWVTGLFC